MNEDAKAVQDALDAIERKIDRKLREIDAATVELAQQRSSMPGAATGDLSGNSRKSLAAQLHASPDWQAVAERRSPRTSVAIKASDLLVKNTVTSDGFATGEFVGIAPSLARRVWLRERMITLPTGGGTVEFSREDFDNEAAEQGGGSPISFEGIPKAESNIGYTQVEVRVPTIAHFIRVSRQALADVGVLQQALETRLLYGLEARLEAQILTGSGTGAQMSGMTASGNFTPFTPTSGETGIDSVSRALAALEAADAVPSVVVLHPNDFRSMTRTKETGGLYVYAQPGAADPSSLWNVPVHVTPAMPEGKLLVADLAQAATLWVRENARVEAGFTGDDFTKNVVVLLAEARAVVAVNRPEAIRFGDLSAA